MVPLGRIVRTMVKRDNGFLWHCPRLTVLFLWINSSHRLPVYTTEYSCLPQRSISRILATLQRRSAFYSTYFWFRLALTLTPSTKKWTADGRHRAYSRVVETYFYDFLRRSYDYFDRRTLTSTYFWFPLALTLTPSTKKWTADGRHRAYSRVVVVETYDFFTTHTIILIDAH